MVEKAIAVGMLPHEFLCAVSRGETIDGHEPSFDERLDAAKAAAPYYAPKLANVEHSGSVGDGKDATDLTDAELAEIADNERRGRNGAAAPQTGKGESPKLH
jgi:hypothetical protein